MKKKIVNILKKYGIDEKEIDIDALWDSSLTPTENFTNILNHFHIDPLNINEKAKLYEEMTADYYKKEAERIEEEVISSFKSSNVPNQVILDREPFKSLYEITKAFISNENHNSDGGYALLIKGRGGIGKSKTIFTAINQYKKECEDQGKAFDYAFITNRISPLGFYEFLYQNSQKNLIVIDDCDIFSNPDLISLLKSSLWKTNNRRVVMWNVPKTKDLLLKKGIPSMFEIKARFIIITNHINNTKYAQDVKALVSRCILYDFDISHQELISIFKSLLENTAIDFFGLSIEERRDLLSILSSIIKPYTINVSLRTLINASFIYASFKPDRQRIEALISRIIEVDEELKFVYENPTNVDGYIERFGKSRRSFYRKKRILKDMGVL